LEGKAAAIQERMYEELDDFVGVNRVGCWCLVFGFEYGRGTSNYFKTNGAEDRDI
jgi:hypothetical protein